MTNYRIRPATPADLTYLHHATSELDRHERRDNPMALATNEDFPARLEEWLARIIEDPNALVLLAESDEQRPLGYILGFIQHRPSLFTPYEHSALIQALWVDIDARRFGIAQHLVSTMESCFREVGAAYCDVQYLKHNQEAEYFWNAMGYGIAHIAVRKFF